jgi:hypothetical protein
MRPRRSDGAGDAIGAIAARERLTARSKAIKELEPGLRAIAVRAIAAPGGRPTKA